MKQQYSFSWGRPAGGALLIGLLAAAVAGCNTAAEILPNPGPEYYPLAVGAYRIYDVADTIWRNNVPTASRFQFREQVAAELSPDATGQPVYRVVRSRRATATDAWAVDSVLTVTVGKSFITEQRGNLRTVELVFPVAEGAKWNLNAFNTKDSIEVINRSYQRVGQEFSVSRGGKTYAYPNTVTTQYTAGIAGDNCREYVLRTTFAQGVGPVYRVKRYFDHNVPGAGICDPAIRVLGQSRSEVLIENGQ
jgi:hypothetical protein